MIYLFFLQSDCVIYLSVSLSETSVSEIIWIGYEKSSDKFNLRRLKCNLLIFYLCFTQSLINKWGPFVSIQDVFFYVELSWKEKKFDFESICYFLLFVIWIGLLCHYWGFFIRIVWSGTKVSNGFSFADWLCHR